jgi:hypothetical protein
MWVHFETIHVNQQPTYATKYPPGQSLFLALGQRVSGHPWYGVLLGLSLMCACICWMLLGWLPLNYALFGTLLAVFQFGITGYWINSYWGGALPAAGGALVLGAVPRLIRRPAVSASLIGSLGIALLANTRPYEGLIVTLASGVALVWTRKMHRRLRPALLTVWVIVPTAVVLFSTCIWMGYYNYRVTGKPWVMPYVVNDTTYATAPHFWLLTRSGRPSYRHEVLRKFWAEWDVAEYQKARANPLRMVAKFIYVLFSTYTPLLLVAVVFALGLFLLPWLSPHYYSPVTGLILYLGCTGVRSLVHRLPKRTIVRRLTAAGFAGAFSCAFALQIFNSVCNGSELRNDQRRLVTQSLIREGSRHVVIVRYSPEHDVHTEWVYNSADIDASTIVWARDMGDARNAGLIHYYSDRKVWLLEPDFVPPRLSPYPVVLAQSSIEQ